MKTKRVLAGFVGATMALTMAGAAFATDNTSLNQTGTAIVPTQVAESCAGHEPGPGEASWHFVYSAQNTGQINAHFVFSAPTGSFDQLSEDQGAIQTWWITTPASVTLDGSQTFTEGTGGKFNLSHTCLGATETSTPNVTPTPTLPEVTPTPTLPQTNTIDQSNTGGPGTSLTLVFALILAIAGGLVAYAMRPRRVGNR